MFLKYWFLCLPDFFSLLALSPHFNREAILCSCLRGGTWEQKAQSFGVSKAWASGSQSAACRPIAPAAPRYLSERQILGLQPGPTEPSVLRMRPRSLCLNKLSRYRWCRQHSQTVALGSQVLAKTNRQQISEKTEVRAKFLTQIGTVIPRLRDEGASRAGMRERWWGQERGLDSIPACT